MLQKSKSDCGDDRMTMKIKLPISTPKMLSNTQTNLGGSEEVKSLKGFSIDGSKELSLDSS